MRTKEEIREYNRQYKLSHKEQIRVRDREYHQRIRERLGSKEVSRQNRQYALRRKVLVLTHYGNGKCACIKCGESRLACLSIDHINAIGASGRGMTGGTNFYAWLVKNNYPEGHQTLCMNCQWVKRFENMEHTKPLM